MEVSSQLHAPAALPSKKETSLPTEQGDWVGLQQNWALLGKENLQPLAGIEIGLSCNLFAFLFLGLTFSTYSI